MKWIIGGYGLRVGRIFFTVNLLERKGNDLLVRHVDVLRAAVAKVKAKYPFYIHAWVVLPDHLHCVVGRLGCLDFTCSEMLLPELSGVTC